MICSTIQDNLAVRDASALKQSNNPGDDVIDEGSDVGALNNMKHERLVSRKSFGGCTPYSVLPRSGRLCGNVNLRSDPYCCSLDTVHIHCAVCCHCGVANRIVALME